METLKQLDINDNDDELDYDALTEQQSEAILKAEAADHEAAMAAFHRTSGFAKNKIERAMPSGNPEALKKWYNDGADGQISWGQSGDFMQCVDIASKYMDEDQAKGFCNERHQDAVGGPPGSEDK